MNFDNRETKRKYSEMNIAIENDLSFYDNGNDFSFSGNPVIKQPRLNKPDIIPNHILLMTIMNPAFPITVDIINTICTPNGNVLRIVIFKKNGVQAMVEFEDVDSAVRVKEFLNGSDIYLGCCTLKIEFAKPTRLNVYKNDHESFDYTNPSLGNGKRERPPLLENPKVLKNVPRFQFRDGSYRADSTRIHESGYGDNRFERYDFPRDESMDYEETGIDSSHSMLSGGAVMMVYGLNMEKNNCDRLFNLFCLYGNVSRVKFLKSKEGSAMVQMSDPDSVERCVNNLNNTMLFDSKMQLSYSKQAYLNEVIQPYDLPDGTMSFKDYIGNRNNRFSNPEAALKNRIQPPSKTLHFFNAPPSITEEDLKSFFTENECEIPMSIKIFIGKSDKSSSGLLHYKEIVHATEILMMCNHMNMENPLGANPYIFKLCYSTNRNQF